MTEKAITPQTPEVTTVLFRAWKSGSEIVALFPYEIWNGYLCTSYMHVGQHGAADTQSIMAATRPAQPAEYASLYEELVSLSPEPYTLKIAQRINGKKQRAAWESARRK